MEGKWELHAIWEVLHKIEWGIEIGRGDFAILKLELLKNWILRNVGFKGEAGKEEKCNWFTKRDDGGE